VVARLERRHPGLQAVYLNGAEGTTSLDAWLPPQSDRPEDWDRQQREGVARFSARLLKGVDAAWRRLAFAGRVRLACGTAAVRMRVLDVDNRETVLTQPLQALAIDDLALVGEQEEAWAEMALGIKARSPFACTCVLGFVGSRNRYFPTAHGIEEGGYESQILYRDGDGFARTIDGAVRLLGSLRREVAP
jgi:hypothetical protein